MRTEDGIYDDVFEGIKPNYGVLPFINNLWSASVLFKHKGKFKDKNGFENYNNCIDEITHNA